MTDKLKPTAPAEPMFDTLRSRAYLRAVADAPLAQVAQWLSTTCDECMMEPEVEGNRSEHGMLGEFVLIGCQGYFQVNPNAVGIPSDGWLDWTLN